MPIEQGVAGIEQKKRPIRNHALPLFTHCAFVATEEIEGQTYNFRSMIEACKANGKVPEIFKKPLGILKGEMSLEEVRRENEEGVIRGFSAFFDPGTLIEMNDLGYTPIVRPQVDNEGNSVLKWDVTVANSSEESANIDMLTILEIQGERAPYFDAVIDELGMHVTLKPLEQLQQAA